MPTSEVQSSTEASAEPTAEPIAATFEPDAALLEARDLAYAALVEITPAETIGEPAGHRVEEDGVVSLLFETKMLGYPGWFWTVSLARVDGEEPTVLEAELMPGESALLAPDWVPWAVRLAEYQATQAALAAEASEEVATEDELDDIDDDELDDDDDDDDFDADEPRPVHGGDLDGVDIDELDDSAADDDDDSDDDDDDDSDEDDDDSDDDESDDESAAEPEPEPAKKRRPRLSWRRMRRS